MTSTFKMFASTSGDAAKKSVLVEFKAGLMDFRPGTKTVEPDKRRGLVQLKKGADSLLHFTWQDRVSGQVQHDLILFPDDAKFRKVEEANARVYLLDFKTSNRKLFFWMQEPSADKDEELRKKVDDLLANGPPAETQNPMAALRGANRNNRMGNMLNALSGGGTRGLDQEQLRNLLAQAQGRSSDSSSFASPSPPSSTSSSATSSNANAGGSNASDTLRGIIGRLAQQQSQPAARTEAAQPSADAAAQTLQATGPSLSDVVDADKIIASGLFDNEVVVQALAQYLPEGSSVTASNLRENVRSPQFQQAVQHFNAALRSGQLNAILTSFGLPTSNSVNPLNTIEEFLLAIQRNVKKDQDAMDTD